MTADENILDNYQAFTATTAVYPGAGTGSMIGLAYLALGLTGEGGEVANKLKKVLRGDYAKPERAFAPRVAKPSDVVPKEVRAAVLAEVGDVLYYCARIVDELGGSLDEVVADNVTKLQSRLDRGVIKGSGDER